MNERIIEEIEDKIQKQRTKMPKEVSKEIMKKIFMNLLEAIGIIIYFVVLNFVYAKIQETLLTQCIEILSGIILFIALIVLEIAYKKDNGIIAITGIELLFISFFTLSSIHISTLLKYDFRYYVLTFSYIFSTYYVLKCIVIYTKERRKYLQSLSDISDIVKDNKPQVKEAKKRNSIEEKDNNDKVNKTQSEKASKTKKSTKKKNRKKTSKNTQNKETTNSKPKNKSAKKVSEKKDDKKEVSVK